MLYCIFMNYITTITTELALVHVRMPPGYSSQGQRNLKIIDAHIAHHSQG